MPTTLSAEAVDAALGTAHARTVSPSKHKWADGYVNEDYPYKPFWDVFTNSLKCRLELTQKEESEYNQTEGQQRIQAFES